MALVHCLRTVPGLILVPPQDSPETLRQNECEPRGCKNKVKRGTEQQEVGKGAEQSRWAVLSTLLICCLLASYVSLTQEALVCVNGAASSEALGEDTEMGVSGL